MRKHLALLALTLSISSNSPVAQTRVISPALVITRVTVIDVVAGRAVSDMTVVVEGDRITALGKGRNVKVPRGAQVIDAAGKFLIPGLWDMHVHLVAPENRDTYVPMLVANGVTGVRDMGMPGTEEDPLQALDVLKRWRKEAAEGTLLAPRIFSAGQIVEGDRPRRSHIMARDEAEARQVVRALKQRGADFVKVRNMIKRDAYFAIIDEAKKLGLPVAGHIPISITPAEASDAGQKSVEHLLSSILWSCSTAEAEMRRQLGEVWDQPDPGLAFSRLASSQLAPHLSTYSEKKAADLFALFRKNRTWQVPTQVIYQLAASYKDSRHLNDPRLRYIPTDVKERWKRGRMSPTDDYLTTQALYRKNLEAVGALNRAGVPLLAGTDTPVPYIIPGFSLHDELALFVQAGLTPAEALRTATINPAKYFNLEKTLGTVERGKLADLVLLEGNPLEDIRNTQRISAVVVNGRLLDRRALNELLARAEAAASKR